MPWDGSKIQRLAGADGGPAEGIARVQFDYDTEGRKTLEAYFDGDKKPVAGEDKFRNPSSESFLPVVSYRR